MPKTSSLRPKIKELAAFSLPLVAGQVGQMLFGIGDTAVAGRFSTEVLAACGVGTALFAPFMMVGLGLTFAVGPLAAQARGAKSEDPALLGSSLFTAFLMGTAILLTMFLILVPIANSLGLDPVIRDLALSYLRVCAPSIYGALIFQVAKEFLQAHDNILFANGLVIVMNVFNIFLNIVLMWGYFGFPQLGIQGAAWATLIIRTSMAAILIIYTAKRFPIDLKPKMSAIKSLVNMGLPIATSTLIEVGVFSTVTLLVGRISIIASAAHNVALNLASLTFMVPLALSSAVAVKVGDAMGRKDSDDVSAWARASLVLAVCFMSVAAIGYTLIPELLLSFATSDPELIAYAKKLLVVVALFQIPDGLQVTLLGVLRGMGITKVPMILSFVANWMIGLPIGAYLAFGHDLEAAGLWGGLASGLYAMFISLTWLFIRREKQLHAS
jgi:MATE family multidrug resistance protein